MKKTKQVEYTTGLLVVTSDIKAGNELAKAVGISTNDANTFDSAPEYIADNITYYVAKVQVIEVYKALALCFNGTAPYTLLNNIGMLDEDIVRIKTSVRVFIFSTEEFFAPTTVASKLAELKLIYVNKLK